MKPTPQAVLQWSRTPIGRKLTRYTLASAICFGITQAVLLLTFGVLRLWSAVVCNVVATAVATVPSYYLNRAWAWGQRGRSHLTREVLPFWALAFAGLSLSMWSVGITERHAHDLTSSHALVTLLVLVANAGSWGVIWVGKFLIFNHLMFVDRPARRRPAPAVGPTVLAGARHRLPGPRSARSEAGLPSAADAAR
jgi:putative flippase GtrA